MMKQSPSCWIIELICCSKSRADSKSTLPLTRRILHLPSLSSFAIIDSLPDPLSQRQAVPGLDPLISRLIHGLEHQVNSEPTHLALGQATTKCFRFRMNQLVKALAVIS